MLPGTFGVSSFTSLSATTAATELLKNQMIATNHGVTGVTGAVVPPGNESASMLASGNHRGTVAEFSNLIVDAMHQISRRNNVMARFSFDALDTALNGAANLAATPVEQINATAGLGA